MCRTIRSRFAPRIASRAVESHVPERSEARRVFGWRGETSQWKERGWQGVDPATDFRSGGLLSLQTSYGSPSTSEGVRQTAAQDGRHEVGVGVPLPPRASTSRTRCATSSSSDPPGAVRGVTAVTGWRPRKVSRTSYSPAPNAPAAVAFTHMLRKGRAGAKDAFERVYAAWFEALDREWLDRGATYMEFGEVMNATRNKVRGALERAGRRNGGMHGGGTEGGARVDVVSVVQLGWDRRF